ncbi:GNAT family N-acetyltransferase [Luteimonas sp. 50]|uniref:GNAT family N-acetyltransferase n=1 Tax=Cognatiluteimonas sedimenti TaxID=2927791 RepID=A0ABT0A2N3_9GAMM|nr:GNAT family N-acetyltransferase [Lysobacter sedimenti]MCJ0825240.1 GNAT family N-acetyltransferase [Lysobacter sedimenti]
MPATDPQLDNPFWSSLRSRHRALALVAGEVARYPPQFAPFLGIADADVDVADALATLVAPGETVLLLGIAPRRLPPGWQLALLENLPQMTCPQRIPVPDGPEIVELSTAHRGDVLALTALVYPHYFRERTMELGRYFGIYQGERLAAMIGERLATATHQEMSAICTHPDYGGRGHARRLTAFLGNDNLDRGRMPFLHVSRANLRARRMYEQLGYRLRRDIPFWSLRRESVAA